MKQPPLELKHGLDVQRTEGAIEAEGTTGWALISLWINVVVPG